MSNTVAAPTSQLAVQLRRAADEITTLSNVPATTASVAELGVLLVELEQAHNQLAGISASWTAEFEAAGGPQEHAAPSLAAWCRRELRLTPTETRRRTRRAAALDALPETKVAFEKGRIGLAHLDALAVGVHQLGPVVMAAVEPALLEVAQTCDADALRHAVRTTRDTLDPDAADAAYLRALERRDLTITQVGEGYDVRGLLDLWCECVDERRESAQVRRPGGRRRRRRRRPGPSTQPSAVRHGLPTDRGMRPQLFVTVDPNNPHPSSTSDVAAPISADRPWGGQTGHPRVGTT